MAYMSQFNRRKQKAFLADYNKPDTGSGKYPPCMNKACKSYGHSHPNCKCWNGGGPELAEGGEVEHFCASERDHMPGCEHYKGIPFSDAVLAKRKAGR